MEAYEHSPGVRVERIKKRKPRHSRGAGGAGAGRQNGSAGGPTRTGQKRGQLHPVVSPQFSHLWQVPLRTVSQPQRGQGGASGVEFMRRTPGVLVRAGAASRGAWPLPLEARGAVLVSRSEERRVGEEWRSRGA